MKLLFSLLLSTVFAASAAPGAMDVTPSKPISASSRLGQSLLSQARRLEDGDEADMTWITDYSLVFQGCYSIKQWNDNADDDGAAMIDTKGLVRFRLCPGNSCGLFCTGYGDYVVDMPTFVEAFVQSQRRQAEYTCQNYMWKHCDCEDSDDKGDDFDREICEYDCYNNGRKYDCIDRNPYNDDEESKDEFEVERYAECQQFEEPEFDDDDANNNRKLEEEEAIAYYIGPYCAKQGGKIFLGMFTDDSCSVFADSTNGRSTYKTLTRGEDLPYATKSIVNTNCISCLEPEDPNQANEQHDDDAWEPEIRVAEVCENTYESAGKCEKKMKNGPQYPNTASCQFIAGVNIVKEDGMLTGGGKNPLATTFIVIFAVACGGLGYYAYLLRKQLGMKSESLL